MKKLSTILTAGVLAMLSVSAFACPKGTQLQGGTGTIMNELEQLLLIFQYLKSQFF